MLGGDSEYSDIEVNSGEERDASRDQQMRSRTASNGLDDSDYSQSRPEDASKYYRKHFNNASDRKEYSSRNHNAMKIKYHGSDNWIARDGQAPHHNGMTNTY